MLKTIHYCVDVFENFRSMSWNIWACYCSFFDYTRFCMARSLKKKTKLKLNLLTDIDMLLIVEKYFRGPIGDAIHIYAKVNNKYMKDYDKNK